MIYSLLAIGGQYSFQELPWNGNHIYYKTLVSTKIPAFTNKNEAIGIGYRDIELYRLETLVEITKHAKRHIYVHDDLKTEEAIMLLQEYLMKQFIQQGDKE